MEALRKDYDVIVVVSGPGGATVAKELSQHDKKVLILEWGGNAPLKGTLLQSATMIGIPGKSLLVTNKKLHVLLRGITTGGSSVFYCGTAFDPPFEMMESHGIDIRDEIEELKKEIPIEPLSDELMGPMANRMMTSARISATTGRSSTSSSSRTSAEPDAGGVPMAAPMVRNGLPGISPKRR